jgi:hypothetical protein
MEEREMCIHSEYYLNKWLNEYRENGQYATRTALKLGVITNPTSLAPTRPAQEELDTQMVRIHPGFAKLREELQTRYMAEFMVSQADLLAA